MSGPDKVRLGKTAGGQWCSFDDPDFPEYTRTDLIPDPHAIARAALEKAADECALRADQIAIRALASDPAALAEIVKGVTND
jgi:hypothetical protein